MGKNTQVVFLHRSEDVPSAQHILQCQGLKRQGKTKGLLGSTENEQENNQMQCGVLDRTLEPKKDIRRAKALLG